MKFQFTFLLLLFALSPIYGKNETIPNPIKHFLNYHHHLNMHREVMFFEVDVNNDNKPDLFISSDNKHLFNAQLGHIYFVYLTKGKKYYWEDNNSIALHYEKLMFYNTSLHKEKVPLILLEEDSIWACSYISNKKNEYKLMDIKWSKHHHSSDIFHNLLKKSHAKNHPLIILNNEEAMRYWKKNKMK